MKKLIKDLVRNTLYARQVFPTDLTDERELKSLLKKLKPIYCGKELIRLGPKGDGGYLIPDDLVGITACFSPGVDRISGFEKDCANMGMQVFLADKSVEHPAESHDFFKFTKKYLGATTNDNFMTLGDWVSSSIPESQDELLLQIDIEGGEYEVFLNTTDQLLKRFRIIVVEFHQLDQLWNRYFFKIASRVFEKLLQTHSCVHNHPNNYYETIKIGSIEIPLLTEITFIRNDRVNNPTFVHSLPHPLDSDNTNNPTLNLPRCWYT